SSGFMTYASDTHPAYGCVRRELEECARTFVLLPSLDRELCIAETVRRQVARPFGRSPEREEAVIRARFEVYMALSTRKIETMRSTAAIVDEIVAALSPANHKNSISELNLRGLLPCCVRFAPTGRPVDANTGYRPAGSLWPGGART